ncbi:MAG: hypothetical protein ABIJ23_02480 [Candidatus Magasanikbacteria bacterium]
MKLLIYSFEKFRNLKSNPGFAVAATLAKKYDAKDVNLVQLPVTHNCWNILKKKMDKF